MRQLVDDMSGTTCKPLAVALTATRQRLDGWKLPTEDVISDEKTVKLGHSVDSLLVGLNVVFLMAVPCRWKCSPPSLRFDMMTKRCGNVCVNFSATGKLARRS